MDGALLTVLGLAMLLGCWPFAAAILHIEPEIVSFKTLVRVFRKIPKLPAALDRFRGGGPLPAPQRSRLGVSFESIRMALGPWSSIVGKPDSRAVLFVAKPATQPQAIENLGQVPGLGDLRPSIFLELCMTAPDALSHLGSRLLSHGLLEGSRRLAVSAANSLTSAALRVCFRRIRSNCPCLASPPCGVSETSHFSFIELGGAGDGEARAPTRFQCAEGKRRYVANPQFEFSVLFSPLCFSGSPFVSVRSNPVV